MIFQIAHNIIKSMLKIIADLHTHTIASGHSYGTIREMAKAADSRGLLVYGHSDHAPLFRAKKEITTCTTSSYL